MHLKPGDPIVVQWIDPQVQSGWVSVPDAKAFTVAKCETWGTFVCYNNDILVIAQTLGTDGKEQEHNNIQSINTGCIKSVHNVSRGAKVRRR